MEYWQLCECECDKLCGIGEYLDYKNCVCRNSIVDKLVEECTKVVDGDKIYNETLNAIPLNDSISDCFSCTPYIVLFTVFLVTSVMIGGVSVYFYWYIKKQLDLKKDILDVKYSEIETLIY